MNSLLNTIKSIKQQQIKKNSEEYVPDNFDTGFADLDIMIKIRRGHLLILAGRPGCGKTSLMLNLANNIVSKCDKRVKIFSLEMSEYELGVRIISSAVNIAADKIKQLELTENEIAKIDKVVKKKLLTNIFIDDRSGQTLDALLCRAERAVKEEGADLLFIDYLQLLSANGDSRYLEISNISRGLKSLAKKLNVPVVCLSQLSRAIERRDDPTPKLSDLRDSGSIEEDADLVMMLSPVKKNSSDRFFLTIAKNRHGMTGKIRLRFRPKTTTFTDL